MIIYNKTDKTHLYFYKCDITGGFSVGIDRPGDGICSDSYPEQAKSLEKHNKKYGG